MADAVGAGVGGADPTRLRPRRPGFAARLRLQVERPELVQADYDRRVAGARLGQSVGDRVQLQDPILLLLEAGIVGALPAPHGLKADAFLTQQLPQPFVGDVVDHLLGDQIVGELGRAPGRKRLAEVGRNRQRDPLDRLTLRQRERARPAAPIARIEGVEAVPVEVVITSRTVSESLNTTAAIRVVAIRCAANSTICARRQVTIEPLVQRIIRNSRCPPRC